MLCAFSSDRRELYKADIYRVISLPEESIVHFRYKKKYVDSRLHDEGVCDGREVVIFFTHGNTSDGETRGLANVSVRSAYVLKTFYSQDTDVFHVYMVLKGFINVKINKCNHNMVPPTLFFSDIECNVVCRNYSWHSVVRSISAFLPKFVYFNVRGLKYKGKYVKLTDRSDSISRFYELNQGQEYVLDMSIANIESIADLKIDIEENSKNITVGNVNPMEVSVQFDDVLLPLYVNNLQVADQYSVLRFLPQVEEDKYNEYAVDLIFHLRPGWVKACSFATASTLGAVAIVLGGWLVRKGEMKNWGCLIVLAFFVFLSSWISFRFFNKK